MQGGETTRLKPAPNTSSSSSLRLPLLARRIESAPVGAQVWARMPLLLPEKEQKSNRSSAVAAADTSWKGLLSALAGVFCASLNQIDTAHTTTPHFLYHPLFTSSAMPASNSLALDENSSFVRYAALPRENVCTENLTPWSKLLPCRKQGGIASLLNSLRCLLSFSVIFDNNLY